MTIDEARAHFAYDEWANARFVTALAELTPATLALPVVSSFPSLLATFAHLVAAEWVWLRRWKGENPRTFPDWMADPSLESLRACLAAVQSERDAYLATLADDDLNGEVSYALMSGVARTGRLATLFLHVVNHSSFHRGQLVTLLRQAGATPPASDLVMYVREQEDAARSG